MTEGEAFPPDFVFGVATSAYQVDGHLENDWTEWERQGRLLDPGARNGRACEHWERFADDVALLQALGVTTYRWSLEWSRLEPRRGEWDEAAWQGTRDRLELLRAAGIRPTVTLHHFTHPPWFHADTPWHEPASLEAWTRYVKRAAELLEGLDAAVVTLNEPNVLVLAGYLADAFPPGLSDGKLAFRALANLMRAHVIARDALRSRPGTRHAPVGIATNMLAFAPDRFWHPLDLALTSLGEAHYNHGAFEALSYGVLNVNMPGVMTGRAPIEGGRDALDFVGVNYYTRAHLRFIPRPPYIQFTYRDAVGRGLTDLGWEYFPEGFGRVLRQLKRYNKPVWVTENGLDDRTGIRRPRFLYEHWRELLGAIRDGVPVTHYFHWALMDNFEWLEAWGPRFGLYHVDFHTMERRPGPACMYYRSVATSRRLLPP